MKRRASPEAYLLLVCIGQTIYAQQALNNLLTTYSNNIKVCNAPHANSCIYETHQIAASISGKYLTIEYGFGWNTKYGYISINKIKIDLSTATIYTGWWSYEYGKWIQRGDKRIVTIKDDNGIDMYINGQQNYNKGIKQDLISSICFDFGTIPIANRIFSEILELQNGHKDKDPWLRPNDLTVKEISDTKPQEVSKSSPVKKSTSTKANPPKSKTISNKYSQ